MADADNSPGSTGEAGVPVIPAPTRSRANLANQSPGLNTQTASHEALRPLSEAALEEPTVPLEPVTPEQGRRTGDAASLPVNLPPADEETDDQRVPAIEEDLPKRANSRHGIATAGGIALAFVCGMCLPTPRMVLETATPDSLALIQAETRRVMPAAPVVTWRAPPRRIELPADPEAALTTALEHLNTALGALPAGSSPEQILRQVSADVQGCLLTWTNDIPSVVYGRELLSPNSLAYTLEDCAEAVSRMR
jgi:hypothetical protein